MQTLTLKIEDSYYPKLMDFIQSLPEKAVKMEAPKNDDKYAQEREIANGVLQGIKDVKAGKTKDIKELLDAI
jgi:hypothetical protein